MGSIDEATPAPGWRDRSTVMDGNALAGPLGDLFAVDPTSLLAVCRACGHESMLAEAVVEVDDVAFLVRCRTCTHTLLTLQRTPGGLVARIDALAALEARG